MKATPFFKNKTSKKLNISFLHLLFFLNFSVALLWYFSGLYPALGDFLKNHFTLCQDNVKNFRVWTLFTHAFSHQNFWEFFLAMFPMALIFKKLKNFFSTNELFRFYLFCGLTGGFFHLVFSPGIQPISGSFGIFLAFLVLFSRIASDEPVTSLFKIPLNLKSIAVFLILLDFMTLSLSFRPDHGSFASHLGYLIFCFCFIKKESADSRFSFASNEKSFSNLHSPISKTSPQKESPFHPKTFENEIDEILDKISEKGMESLSEREKILLKSASLRKNPNSGNY